MEATMRATLNSILVKRKALTLTAVTAGLAIVALVLFAARSTKPAAAAPRPLDVQVVTVEQKDVPVYSEWIGSTDGAVNAEIKAQITGYLLHQTYKEGAFVKKGELLFEIDPKPFAAALDQANAKVLQFEGQVAQATSQISQAEAQVSQANSQVLQAQAQLAQIHANQVKTQLDADRETKLVESGVVSKQEYDDAVQANLATKAQVNAAEAGVESARAQLTQAKAQVNTAKAGVAAAKGQLETAKAEVNTAIFNLGLTKIVAPIDGVAGIAQAQVGNLVSPTSASLTTVSTVDPIKVYFALSEQEYLRFTKRDLIRARPGASVTQMELELILADGTIYPQKGSFYLADRQVDQKTGAIRIAGVFPNPGNVLRPGQYGRVRAVTLTRNNALLVPQRAIAELQGSYQIAVIGNGNRVEFRPVKVGDRIDSMAIIQDGLKAGETVVVEGTQKIKTGAVVNPKPYAGKPTSN
jgi:RND family efflux transporter MFP subunit